MTRIQKNIAPTALTALGLLVFGVPQARAQLDETWVVTVAGQSVWVNPDGSFLIPNIAVPDLIGEGGPGVGPPDFLGDDPVRLIGVSTSGPQTLWAFSDPFVIEQGVTFVIPNLTVTDQVPAIPAALELSATATLLEPGQTSQLTTLATLADGSQVDVTPKTSWTTYRTSNADVATVDNFGLVTAQSPGIVFMTATNEGATAVQRLDISAQLVSTTADGFVERDDGTPLVGVTVTAVPFGGAGVTDGSGHFSFDIVTPSDAQVTLAVQDPDYAGASEALDVVADGFTDAGIIVALPAAEVVALFDGPQFPTGRQPRPVAVADFNGDGRPDMAVGNVQDDSVTVIFKGPGALTVASNTYAVGGAPLSTLASDIDADGDVDLIVGNSEVAEVLVFINPGDGLFSPPLSYPAGGGPTSMALADFDGDSVLDVAVGRAFGVDVLLNDGSGVLGAPIVATTIGTPTVVAAADLDGDGDTDLVRVAGGGFNVLRNDGTASFLTEGFTLNGGSSASGVVLRDFDADTDIDVAVTHLNGDNVGVILNNGDGTFAGAVTYPTGDGSAAIAAADMDGEQSADLMVVNQNSNDVVALLNNGDGTFTEPFSVPVGGSPRGLALADMDLDGDTDAVATNHAHGSVSVMLNDGGLWRLPYLEYDTGNDPWSLVTADFDDDGNLDLAVANNGDGANSFSVLLSLGGGAFLPQLEFPSARGAADVVSSDFDGDGTPDVAIANLRDDCVSLHFNAGAGSFGRGPCYAVPENPLALAAADIDLDGDMDIAVANTITGGTTLALTILENLGDGTFVAPVRYGPDTFPAFPVLGDFDSDGDLDVAIANGFGNDVVVRMNDGTGMFGSGASFPAGLFVADVEIGDMNGDGALDLVTAHEDGNDIGVLLNDGNGIFGPAMFTPTGEDPQTLRLGDLDGDGDLDVAVVNIGDTFLDIDSELVVSFNDGSGVLGPVVSLMTFTALWEVALGDLDADGDLDIVAPPAANPSEIAVFLNNGDGTFQATSAAGPSTLPIDVALADVDGDGDLDAGMVGFSGIFTILPGEGDGTFGFRQNYGLGAPWSLKFADIDADGFPDAVVSLRDLDQLAVLPNNGLGEFFQQDSYPVGVDPRGVSVGDLELDGDLDVVVGLPFQFGTVALHNFGDGTLPARVDLPDFGSTQDVALGDVNEDGLPDVTLVNGSGVVSLRLNLGDGMWTPRTFIGQTQPPFKIDLTDLDGVNGADMLMAAGSAVGVALSQGDGTFIETVWIDVSGSPQGLATGDADGDGVLDVLSSSNVVDQFVLLSGLGLGAFEPTQYFATRPDPRDLIAVDIDGDGDLDVVAVSFDDKVTVHLNRLVP